MYAGWKYGDMKLRIVWWHDDTEIVILMLAKTIT